MSVPKVLLPADFGIENLNSKLHGNIVITLQDNTEKQANSMIIALQSPVYAEMFLKLGIPKVEMDDFSVDSANIFLKALYSGEITITRDLFRDTNKISHVFNVQWIKRKVENHFSDFVEKITEDDLEDMYFAFEEARFAKNIIKQTNYLDIVLEKLTCMVNTKTLFVERYMSEDYRHLSRNELDLMIEIAGENVHIFMKIIKSNVEAQGLSLGENTRYLLQRIDLVKCRVQDKALYEALFDVLLERIESISTENLKIIVKLDRDAKKEYDMLKEQNATNVQNTPEQLTGTEVVPVNLFQSLVRFKGLKLDQLLSFVHLDQALDAVSNSAEVRDLYMFFEIVNCNKTWKFFRERTLRDMVNIKQKRRWRKIRPEFLDGLFSLSSFPETLGKIKGCNELMSDTDSIKLVCNRTSYFRDMITLGNVYKFNFEHPITKSCSRPTQCGFIIKVTPGSKESPELFNIQLITDPDLYPVDLHYHSAAFSPSRMHFVAEIFYNKWYNMILSWEGKPVYNYDDDTVNWRGEFGWFKKVKGRERVRFVAYYEYDSTT